MAPGVNVERISTDKWAVSIRGFNSFSSDKVQVLVDGRSDYSPIITGTLWMQQDTFIEDIERIEVIRGPAGAVWGTNAVNGVINIITKKAADTQGVLLTAGGGSFEHGFSGRVVVEKLTKIHLFAYSLKDLLVITPPVSMESMRMIIGTQAEPVFVLIITAVSINLRCKPKDFTTL